MRGRSDAATQLSNTATERTDPMRWTVTRFDHPRYRLKHGFIVSDRLDLFSSK
jgi:hypothetical protein